QRWTSPAPTSAVAAAPPPISHQRRLIAGCCRSAGPAISGWSEQGFTRAILSRQVAAGRAYVVIDRAAAHDYTHRLATHPLAASPRHVLAVPPAPKPTIAASFLAQCFVATRRWTWLADGPGLVHPRAPTRRSRLARCGSAEVGRA